MDRRQQNRLSAEWAAYGDALGFMTELADVKRVKYRLGRERVEHTLPWKRKVGGYRGQTIDLPAGTYSDDTQLRLATSRAIRADSRFDVSAFAKVELPAWSNYALGAGVGSKEAVANLSRTSATWYSNFFDNKKSRYVNGGGNGAAMRIQPHVWASSNLIDIKSILIDVIKNSICTHGHMRGILGACFHATSLAFAMRKGHAPQLEDCLDFLQTLRLVPKLIESDGDLRTFWVGAWQDASGYEVEEACSKVIDEILFDIRELGRFKQEPLGEIYPKAAKALGAFEASSRGSGTKTAILASFVASLANIERPHDSLLTVVNTLGTDTDSIATMAGAIIGACTSQGCEFDLQDRDYIRSEADRLTDISANLDTRSFRYPNLRNWRPEKTAIDAIGLLDGDLYLSGIGALTKIDYLPLMENSKENIGWFNLPFGQSVLVRFRPQPQEFSIRQSTPDQKAEVFQQKADPQPPGKLRDLFDHTDHDERREPTTGLEKMALSDVLRKVIAEGFPPELIGRALLMQVDNGGKEYLEKGVALTANILTAYEARTKHTRKR
ncbi:ADP-ribosylglycohydrolase family protein [Tritonibacter mobilis]|uniref:ADP-ribosylglycohydrolase family protein n=1 Tax=Tritonibacter mobilis TaxID=379347 RepID=UPI000806D879|nr:ADP-ribosylglycohydrolase family protein [Tritonibacter mobilis]